jgi:hypothetical protein
VAGVSVSIYAWQQNRQLSADVTTKNSQIAELQKQASAPAKTTPTTQPTPAPAATYLDIKEFGVKIKLSDDIKDAVYHYYGSDPSAPTASISSQSLMNKSSQCDPRNTPAFGAMTKKQSLTTSDGQAMTVNNTTVFQVGSGYFIYSTPQAPCTLNSTDQATEISQLASFKQALKTLQPDQ